MSWKEAAADLGTATLISGLKALEGTMKKRDFKRLVATTAAQVLAVHPDVKPRKARRWARKATGTRPERPAVQRRVRQARQQVQDKVTRGDESEA